MPQTRGEKGKRRPFRDFYLIGDLDTDLVELAMVGLVRDYCIRSKTRTTKSLTISRRIRTAQRQCDYVSVEDFIGFV